MSTTVPNVPNVHPSALPRYNGVATRLKTLPSEVVHHILDDLDLLKILEILIVHSHPSLDRSIQSHPQLRSLLCQSPTRLGSGTATADESLEKTKEAFRLYFSIIQSKRKPQHPSIPSLKKDSRTLINARNPPNVLTEITTAIIRELEPFVPYFPILNSFTGDNQDIPDRECWDVDDISELKDIWTAIKAAETTLNLTKSAQLTRLASLISEHPYILTTSSSTTQEPPSPHATTHRASMFQQAAKRMSKPQLHCSRIMSTHIFGDGGGGRLPIVPYNRTLRVLLKILRKFPLEPERNILTGKPLKPLVFEWPEEVKKDWDRVLGGLGYVYTEKCEYPTREELLKEEEGVREKGKENATTKLEEKEKEVTKEEDEDESDDDDEDDDDEDTPVTKSKSVATKPSKPTKPPLRTHNTPRAFSNSQHTSRTARKPTGLSQPRFVTRKIDRHVKKEDTIRPLDEREFEWLDAYLRVCTFIAGGGVVGGVAVGEGQGEGGEWMWREGVSVKEYWRVHAECRV